MGHRRSWPRRSESEVVVDRLETLLAEAQEQAQALGASPEVRALLIAIGDARGWLNAHQAVAATVGDGPPGLGWEEI